MEKAVDEMTGLDPLRFILPKEVKSYALPLKAVEILTVRLLFDVAKLQFPLEEREKILTALMASDAAHRLWALTYKDELRAQDFAALAKLLRVGGYATSPACARMASLLALRATAPYAMPFHAMAWLAEVTGDDFPTVMEKLVGNYAHDFFSGGMVRMARAADRNPLRQRLAAERAKAEKPADG